jgi:glycosyltransferase involved in cell wall biosynthesis
VTFALLAYNQESFIREAVEGAFSQTYEPLEIILSDDYSSDKTFGILKAMAVEYNGPHNVILRQNKINKGLIEHVNHITSIMKGEILVFAAGDDISLPNRTKKIVSVFENNPKAFLVHSEVTEINEKGSIVGEGIPPIGINYEIEDLTKATGIYIGATGAIHKDLFKYFRSIIIKNTYEDQIYGYRAALIGEIKFLKEKLVNYRVGVGISYNSFNSSIIIKNRRKLLNHKIDTLKQKKLDLEKSNHSKLDQLNKINESEMSKCTASLDFYNRKMIFVSKLFSSQFSLYFSALYKETKYLTKHSLNFKV